MILTSGHGPDLGCNEGRSGPRVCQTYGQFQNFRSWPLIIRGSSSSRVPDTSEIKTSMSFLVPLLTRGHQSQHVAARGVVCTDLQSVEPADNLVCPALGGSHLSAEAQSPQQSEALRQVQSVPPQVEQWEGCEHSLSPGPLALPFSILSLHFHYFIILPQSQWILNLFLFIVILKKCPWNSGQLVSWQNQLKNNSCLLFILSILFCLFLSPLF